MADDVVRDISEEMVEKAARRAVHALARQLDMDPDKLWTTALQPSERDWYRSEARAVLSAALAGRTVVDTSMDSLAPEALNAVANAVHDHYGFVRLDVRYEAAAAAIRIVEAWQNTPIPAAGSGVGDQTDEPLSRAPYVPQIDPGADYSGWVERFETAIAKPADREAGDQT